MCGNSYQTMNCGGHSLKVAGTNSSLNICCSLVRQVTWLYAQYNTLETHILNTFFTSSYEAWRAFPQGHLGRFNTNSTLR